MANTVAYGRALFYPHIDFHDEKWLKTAALYYKGLNRIVPEGYTAFRDSEVVQQLNENEDFVRDINPSSASGKVEIDFLDFARNELTDSKRREELINSLGSKISTTEPYSIHMHKIGHKLQYELPKLGLAVKYQDGDWFEFEPVTGAMYMTCLANHLAGEDRLPVVTDEPAFQPLIRGVQLDKYRGNKDVGETLASMVIQSSVPQNIENISITKILRFRKDYEDERHLFYNEINKLVKDLETIDSENALKDSLEARKKDIDIAVRNLDLSLKGVGIATAVAMIGLSIPSFASGLGFGIAAAGVVAVAAGKLTGQGIEHYKSRKSSPYSYVLSLKRQLKAETFAEQLLKGKILL